MAANSLHIFRLSNIFFNDYTWGGGREERLTEPHLFKHKKREGLLVGKGHFYDA